MPHTRHFTRPTAAQDVTLWRVAFKTRARGGWARLLSFLCGAASMLLVGSRPCLAEKTFYPGPWANDVVVGPGMQASGRNLSGSNFTEHDLTGAVFDGADVSSTIFQGCELRDASFRGASLNNTVFADSGRSFATVDFTDAQILGARFMNDDLSAAQLMSTRSYKKRVVVNCHLTGYYRAANDDPPILSFAGFNLTGTHFLGDFTGVDFTDALIDGATFYRGTVRFKQIAATKNYRTRALRNMTLWFENEDVDFSGIDLSESHITVKNGSLKLDGAIITRACFHADIGSQISATANYKNGEILFVKMPSSDLNGVDLSRQNLTGCSFDAHMLEGAKFDDAVITGADFGSDPQQALELTIEQIKATWNYKNGRMDGIILPKAIADALAREKTDGACEP